MCVASHDPRTLTIERARSRSVLARFILEFLTFSTVIPAQPGDSSSWFYRSVHGGQTHILLTKSHLTHVGCPSRRCLVSSGHTYGGGI